MNLFFLVHYKTEQTGVNTHLYRQAFSPHGATRLNAILSMRDTIKIYVKENAINYVSLLFIFV